MIFIFSRLECLSRLPGSIPNLKAFTFTTLHSRWIKNSILSHQIRSGLSPGWITAVASHPISFIVFVNPHPTYIFILNPCGHASFLLDICHCFLFFLALHGWLIFCTNMLFLVYMLIRIFNSFYVSLWRRAFAWNVRSRFLYIGSTPRMSDLFLSAG